MTTETQPPGAEILLRALKDQGVEILFGYPGGAVLPIYDSIFKQNRLRHILVRHEQGGAHAADGYSRVTGRVGVCMGTSGPGATNLVTGIGTALLDSIPMVVAHENVHIQQARAQKLFDKPNKNLLEQSRAAKLDAHRRSCSTSPRRRWKSWRRRAWKK